MDLTSGAISAAIALGVFILLSAVLAALQRRGWDPVADIARLLSPNVVGGAEEPDMLEEAA